MKLFQNSELLKKMFHAFIFCCCCLVGVFADELKSVMEGDSVTLQTNVTELQKGDRIKWLFGTNRSLIAKIFELTIDITGDLDERFKDRLKLDIKTGSLTITDIRTEHAGDYEVEISISRSSSYKHRFTVTVYAAPTTTVPVTSLDSTSFSPSSSSGLSKCEHVNITVLCQTCAELHGNYCDSAEAVLRLVATALMGVAAAAAAVLLVNDVRSTRGKKEETEQMS